MNPNINADTALQAHVDKVIASDGVDVNIEAIVREAVASVDIGKVWAEARQRFINDMTNPIDTHEHVCRVAAEHGIRAALGALRALEGE